ncbi:hypothetical protein N7452_004145 [Penicillium brevicompactum]|uniref:Uncharacterized protein n=1 Tax=Penicillium brevicompactum TaxID=5074 RepID=A0A9W9QUX0_PENBR|nr:hypothetical protein N7452_004145 [Penicillium brevicompactum]
MSQKLMGQSIWPMDTYSTMREIDCRRFAIVIPNLYCYVGIQPPIRLRWPNANIGYPYIGQV